jgi:predicted nucleic acid-binding protein
MSILTFVDAGVLIVAARGTHTKEAKAQAILGDASREFCATSFLELEVRPKAIWFPNNAEALYYETFFNAVSYWEEPSKNLVDKAFTLACDYGLGAIDALHAAAALELGVDEFITTEKKSKPLFRIPNLNVSEL